MRPFLRSICLLFVASAALRAQTGCPGCIVKVPTGLPADTLYLDPIPDAEQGVAYEADISFRVPKTTTPVNAIDSTTPPGLAISKIEIVSVDGLPYGLYWEANQTVFETAVQTDGCIKICGTPYQKDSFTLTVKLKATVFIFTQEASFPMSMYVAPKVSATDGFTLTDFTGCGSATVTLTNNIPSGGNPGFAYTWDFGDGTTSTEENPPPHTYTKPGQYIVNYHATIDTGGYRLLSAKVLAVDGCTDFLGVSAPDLYLFILDPTGTSVYNSSPAINNTSLPHNFQPNLLLGEGSYRLEVWDEDSGLEGSDDPCGTIYFTRLNDGDTIVSGSFKVVLEIDHQVEEVMSTDTVIVYAQPAKPKLTANKLSACVGATDLVLESSYGTGNQWYRNGVPISGAVEFLYIPTTSGYYQVQFNTMFGCSSISDSTFIEFHPLPAVPVFINDRNNLELADTNALPANFALQWYLFAMPIDSATGFTYCAQVNGEYSLVVTDVATGCTNAYTSVVAINPMFDCTVGTGEVVTALNLVIFPNPAKGQFSIRLPEPLPQDGALQIWDMAGRLIQYTPASGGNEQLDADSSQLPAGTYLLELRAGDRRYLGRLAVVR